MDSKAEDEGHQCDILRGTKRKRGDDSDDIRALQHMENYVYVVGTWLATPMVGRTAPQEFAFLMAEGFLPDGAARTQEPTVEPAAPIAREALSPQAAPARWADLPCPWCQEDNWYWTHFCRRCGLDKTGYRHWPDCSCWQCREAAETQLA